MIVSSILNDVIAKFINEHQDLITNVLSPIFEIVINAVLASGGQTTTVNGGGEVTSEQAPISN